MRIIPGNTKVQIEIFKGITVWDMLVAALATIMFALIILSTLPYKIVFAVIHLFIAVLLLARLDKEPNYIYLLNIIRHFGFRRRFDKAEKDAMLIDKALRGDDAVNFDQIFPERIKKPDIVSTDSETDAEVPDADASGVVVNKDEDADSLLDELGDDRDGGSIMQDQTAETEDGSEAAETPDMTEEPEEHEETKEERKARLKREKEEYKADTKLLKSKTLTKEEEDAIWKKRAAQSEANKKAKKNAKKKKSKNKENWAEMEEISAFTAIRDGYIEYGNQYYGAAIEIPSVEFRFFSEFRRANSIENGLGSILRSFRGDYSMNIVKIERPVDYQSHLDLEYKKLDDLRASFEAGFFKEDELQARIAIVYDRIYDLMDLRDTSRVVIPFYYLVLFDSDKKQLDAAVDYALESLRTGEMGEAKRLGDKELAVFLKYTNAIDFNESDINKIRPEDYAKWAMPDTVEFKMRNAVVNGMVTHNFRVVSYPTAVNDGWLASLMTYSATKVVVKMKKMDSGKAISAIDKSLSELRAKISSARTDSEAMDAQLHLETLQLLLSSLQGENESLLDVNVYVTGYDVMTTNENPKFEKLPYESLRARVSNMKKVMRRAWQEYGFRLNNMEFNQAFAYIGSQISGYDPMSKDGRGIPSNTVAACFPWVFPYVMDDEGIKLGASDGVPVFIDFFRRDSERVNSNMVIVGKSGSGKSYATKALLSNLAADDAKIFILDPEDEYTDLAKNLNGKFINVANAQYGRLNPFHIITTLDDDESEGQNTSSYATHLQFLEEFFKQILPDCDRDSLEYLNALIDRVYATKGINPYTDLSKLRPEDYPIFDDLYDEILREFQRTDSEYIKSMLRTLMNYISKFSEGGRNAVIWNGPSSITTEENFTVFNFQSLLANRNATVANAQMLLVLKYIDNEIIKNRDYNEKYGLKRKIVVVIDEAHVFIDTKFPVALDFMFQLAKRIRKYNGMQIVITQNIKDFVGSEEIARKSTAIINACQYSFIFALSPNDMDDLCKLYEKAGGINENEQEQIVQAPRGQAFAVMSPTSRTSFRVTVPDNIRRLFSDTSYINPYFEGEGGDQNWADYIRDSAEIRENNLGSRKSSDNSSSSGLPSGGLLLEEVVETEDFSDAPQIRSIKFDEMSEEEYSQSEESINEISFSEFAAAPVDASSTLAPATQAIVQAPLQIQVPTGPSKTEEMLAELTLRLGSDSMVNEIKKTVREELDRELANRQFTTVAAAPAVSSVSAPAPQSEDLELPQIMTDDAEDEDLFGSEAVDVSVSEDDLFSSLGQFDFSQSSEEEKEEDDGIALGNIFDFASLGGLDDIDDDEIENDIQLGSVDEDIDEEEDDDDDNFDVMAFLAKQADEIDDEIDDESIENFINGSETLLDVTLEQLISYNRKIASNQDEDE